MNSRTTTSLTSITLLAIVGMASGIARAQDGSADGPGNDYCVIHSFDLRTQGNLAPLVQMIYNTSVRARTNTCKDLVPGPKDNAGTDTVAPFDQFALSTAPDSTGRANSLATITTIQAGRVTGSFEASGSGTPSLTGCPTPAPRRSTGSVKCSSSTKVQAKGQKLDRRGRIKAAGGWRSTETVRGRLHKTIGRDPVKARLIDLTTGVTTEYELFSVKWAVGDGTFEWDGANLANSAPDLDLKMMMNSPVTVQQGTLDFQVRGGIVTRHVSTGEFAALGLPPVGAGGMFSVPFAEVVMDFDLGGDETHDLATEFEFDNAGEVEKVIGIDGQEYIGQCVLTDLGTGHDGAHISEIALPDVTMGFACTMPMGRCARLLDFPPQTVPIELVAMSLTSYGAAPIQVYARIWQGPPGLGVLIAGDLSTNRLVDIEPIGAYRVPAHDVRDSSKPLSESFIDLTWVPPLPPNGQYWIEFATRSETPTGQTFVIQSPWETEQVASMQFVPQLNQWRPTMDQGSGRLVTLAVNVYGAPEQVVEPCYADCDGVGGLTANDFVCFLTAFNNGASYANCDGVGGLTPNDFACFLSRAVQGCN